MAQPLIKYEKQKSDAHGQNVMISTSIVSTLSLSGISTMKATAEDEAEGSDSSVPSSALSHVVSGLPIDSDSDDDDSFFAECEEEDAPFVRIALPPNAAAAGDGFAGTKDADRNSAQGWGDSDDESWATGLDLECAEQHPINGQNAGSGGNLFGGVCVGDSDSDGDREENEAFSEDTQSSHTISYSNNSKFGTMGLTEGLGAGWVLPQEHRYAQRIGDAGMDNYPGAAGCGEDGENVGELLNGPLAGITRLLSRRRQNPTRSEVTLKVPVKLEYTKESINAHVDAAYEFLSAGRRDKAHAVVDSFFDRIAPRLVHAQAQQNARDVCNNTSHSDTKPPGSCACTCSFRHAPDVSSTTDVAMREAHASVHRMLHLAVLVLRGTHAEAPTPGTNNRPARPVRCAGCLTLRRYVDIVVEAVPQQASVARLMQLEVHLDAHYVESECMHILKALSTAYDVLMGKVSTGGGASDSYSHASMSQTMNRTMNSPMHTGKGTDTHTQANAAPNNCPSAQMDTESVAAIKARTDANFEETTGTRTQSSKDGAKGKYTSNKASSNGGAGLKVLESGRSATANTRTNEVAQLLAASAKSDTRAQVAADIVGLCDRTTRGGGTMTRSTANTDADTKQAMTGVYSHIGAGASQQSGKAADKHGGCSAAAEVGSAYMGASVAGDRKGLGRSPMRSLIVLFSHSVAQLELARVEEMDKERVRAQRMAFEAAQCVCKCVCTVCVDSGEAASGSKYVTKDCGDSGSADTINGNEANKNVGTDTDTEKRTPQEPFNMLNNVLRPRIPSRSHGNGRARGRSETDLTQLITGPVMAVHRDLRVLILADVYMLLQGLSPLTGEAASASLQLPEFRPVSNRFSTITSTASRHGINVSYERLLQDLDRTMVHILEPLCQADTLSNDTQPDAPANITGRTNDPPHSIPHTHAHASRSVSAREATIGPSDLCLGKASYCLGLYYFNQQGALDVAREWMQLSLNTFYPHSDATCDAARLPKELSVPLRDDYEGGLGYQHNHNTHAATLAENERYSAGLTTTRTGTDPPTPTRARTRQNAQHTRGLATNPSIGKKHTKGKGGKLWSGASPQTRNAIMCIAGGCEKDAEVDARSGCHGDEAKGAAESGAETSLHVGLSNAAKESTLNITCGDVRKSARCSAENQIGECAHTSVGGERGGCRACAPLTTGLLVAVPYPQLGYTALKAHGETLVALERHTEALDVMSLGRGVHAALYFSAGDVGLMRNLACLYSYQADDCNTSSSRKSLWVDRAVECYTMVLTECAKRHRTNETAQCVHELARLQSRHMRHEGEVTTLSNGLRTIDRLTRAQKQKRQTLSTTPVITIPILEPSVGSLPTGPGGCHAMPCIHENMEDTTLANVHAPLASPSTLSTDAANGRRHSVGVCSGPTADHSTCTAATSGFDSGFFGSPRTQCNVPSPSPALAWGWLTVGASAISVKLCVELAEAMMAQGSYETAAVCLETLLNGSSSACASTTRSTRASLQPSTSKSSVSGFSMGGLNIGLSTVSTTNSSHAHSNTSASPGVGANGGQMAGSNGSAGVKSVAMSYLSPTSRAKVKHTLALCFMRKRWLREAMSLLLIGSQDVYRHSNCTQCLVGERPKPMPRTVQSQRWMKSQSLLVKVFMLAGEWGRAVATCDALLSVCGAAGGMNAVRMKILKRKGTALRKWALTSGGGGCMGLADTRVTDLYDHLSVQEMLAVSAESLRTAMELYVAAGDEVRAAKCVQALTRTTLEMIFVPVVVQGCAAETVLAMCGNGSISSNLQTIRNDAEWALSELLRLTAHPIHLIGAQLSLAEYWVIHAHTMRQAKTLEQDMSRYVEAVADAQNRTLVYWNECKDLLVALVVTNKGLVPWDTRADNRSAEKMLELFERLIRVQMSFDPSVINSNILLIDVLLQLRMVANTESQRKPNNANALDQESSIHITHNDTVPLQARTPTHPNRTANSTRSALRDRETRARLCAQKQPHTHGERCSTGEMGEDGVSESGINGEGQDHIHSAWTALSRCTSRLDKRTGGPTMATVDNTRRSTTTHDVDTARGTSSLIDDGCAMQALSGGVSAGENATNILCRYNRRLTAEAIRQTRLQRLQALPQMSCACLDTDSALASANTSDTHTIKRTSRSFPSATGPNTHNGPCTQSAFSMDRVPHDATTPITSGECGQGECAMDGRTREDVRVHTCGMVDRQPVNLGYATQAEVLGPYSAALYVIPIDAITYTYSPASQMRPIASRMSNRLLSDPQPACHTAQEGSHVLKLSNASDMICSDVHKLDCTDKLPGVSESTSPDLHPTPDALCRIGSQHDNRHIQLPNGKLSKSSHTTAHVDTDHMRTGNGIQALRGGTKMPKELLRYICEALNVSPNVLATTATPTPTSTLSHDARATHPPPTIPKATNLAGAGVPSCVPGRHWDQVSAQHAPHEDGKGCGQGQTDCGGLLEQLRHMYDAAITVAWEVQTGTQATRAGMCTPVHPLHACAVSQGTGVSTTRECRGNSVCYSPARSGSKGSGVASALNNIPESEACAYREQEMLSKPTGDSCSAHEAERRRDGTAALSPSQKPPVSAAHLRESVRRGTKTPPASLDSYQPAQRTSSSGPAMGKATSTPVLTTRRSNENGMAVVASRLSASVSSPTKIGTSGCHGNGNGNGRERGTFIQRLFGGLFSSSSSSKNSIQSQSLTLQTNFNSNTNIAPTLDDLAATLSTPPCSIPTNTNAIAQFQLNHESFSRNSSPSTSLPTTPNWLNPFSRITGSPTSTAHALTGYSSDGDYSGDYGNGRVLALGPAGRTEIRRKTLILVTTPELHVLPWEQILGDDSCMRLLSVVSSSPSVSSSTDDCHGYTGKTSFHSPTPGRGTIVTFFSSENEDEAVLQAHRLHNSARSLAHHLTGASAAGQRHAQHTTSTCRATAEPLQQCLCEADCDSLDHMACTHIPSACRRKHEHTAPTATTATGAQPPLTTGSTVPSTTGPSQTSPKHPPTEPPLQLSTCWCLRHGDRHTSAADPFPSLVAVGKKVSRYRRAYSKDVKFVDTSEGASAGLPYLTRAVDGVIVAGRLNVLVLTTADMTSATNGLMCVQTLSRTAGSVSADAKPLVTVVVPAHLVKETIRVLLKHKQTKRGQSFLAHLISSVAKIREKHMTSIAVFGVPVGPT